MYYCFPTPIDPLTDGKPFPSPPPSSLTVDTAYLSEMSFDISSGRDEQSNSPPQHCVSSSVTGESVVRDEEEDKEREGVAVYCGGIVEFVMG